MSIARPTSIAFLAYWEAPERTYRRHCWMTPGRSGVWGGLKAAASPWRADWVVVHQGLPGRRYQLLPPWRLLRLRHEPSYVAPDLGRSIWPGRLGRAAFEQDFSRGDVPMAATWWIGMDYDALVRLESPPKTRALSAVVSGKTLVEGHRRRLVLLSELARRHPAAVDIYGRGLESRELGSAYKGALERDSGFPLERNCKYDGLRDYRYSLCLENGRERNYYTEKIVDAWLSWTVPIYWGCPNLTDYYPRESFHEIDIDSPGAVDEIVRLSREPVRRATLEAIGEARQLVLHRYGVWGTVARLLGA